MAGKKTIPASRTKPEKPRKKAVAATPINGPSVDPTVENLAGSSDPRPLKPRHHYKEYIAGFMSAILLFVGSTWLALRDKTMAGWERPVFDAINGLPDSLRPLGLVATVTHESTMIGAAAVIATFLFKKYQLSLRLAFAVIGGYAVTAIAKHLIGRERPFMFYEHVQQRATDTGMGFPSGHTMIVTIISLMLLPYLPGWWKLLVPVPIIMMAWSRIYLGLHAPLDVVGGFAVGLGVVCFLRILPTAIARFFRLD